MANHVTEVLGQIIRLVGSFILGFTVRKRLIVSKNGHSLGRSRKNKGGNLHC